MFLYLSNFDVLMPLCSYLIFGKEIDSNLMMRLNSDFIFLKGSNTSQLNQYLHLKSY